MNGSDPWEGPSGPDIIGTRSDREALFEYLVSATLRRQAVSPKKNTLFDMDVETDMGRLRDSLINAGSASDVWYALVQLSNTRHDRHLSVRPVADGLPLPETIRNRINYNYADLSKSDIPRAGIRLATDFSQAQPIVFLSDVAHELRLPHGVAVGDRLVTVNGARFEDFATLCAAYVCHSTPNYFWYHLPVELVHATATLPPAVRNKMTLGFQTGDGTVTELLLTYEDAESWSWPGVIADPYAGWSLSLACASYTLYLHPEKPILALFWHGFGPTLVADIDALMAFADARRLLGHAIVFDATRARGGNFGGYLLQRLSSRPVRINFGDLRLCDVTNAVIECVLEEDRLALATCQLSPDEINATRWRKQWFNEIRSSSTEGGSSRPVPFKCAHQPPTGDGVLHPAPLHFTGPIACLTMPFGGSHIDQVVAQMSDNGMCRQFGMPLGGYSKTYVHEETLTWPSTGKPIATFMWSCGNTFRPNGEVLEGNPAVPQEIIVPTRTNFRNHHALLVNRAIEYLQSVSQGTSAMAEEALR